ncbi:MAG: hypothetical protein ICV83_31900, partial [Cytophagales bacterium]|nr:hypothetical protein [Cytophagales bacterium]
MLQLCEAEPAPGIRYNSPLLLRLGHTVDYQALNAAFAQLLARHESLRTGFKKNGEDYQQLVYDRLDPAIADCTATAGSFAELSAQLTCEAFPLDGSPLFRTALYNTRDEGFLLWLDKHLLLADRYSDELLVKELAGLYGGQAPEAVRIQYVDYTLWQCDPARTEQVKENGQYWSALLQDYTP